MLIYEVNLSVDNDIANEYAAWLREHVREMLGIDGFETAAWYLRDEDNDASDRRHWTIHYHVADRQHLQDYLDHRAGEMRKAASDRFEGRFHADRRVLEQKRVFSQS